MQSVTFTLHNTMYTCAGVTAFGKKINSSCYEWMFEKILLCNSSTLQKNELWVKKSLCNSLALLCVAQQSYNHCQGSKGTEQCEQGSAKHWKG